MSVQWCACDDITGTEPSCLAAPVPDAGDLTLLTPRSPDCEGLSLVLARPPWSLPVSCLHCFRSSSVIPAHYNTSAAIFSHSCFFLALFSEQNVRISAECSSLCDYLDIFRRMSKVHVMSPH